MRNPVRSLVRVSGVFAIPLFLLLPLAPLAGIPSVLAEETPLVPPTHAFEKALTRARKVADKPDRFAKAIAEVARLAHLDDRCGYCLLELAQVERQTEKPEMRDQAIATTRAALALHGPRIFSAQAHNQLGTLLVTPDADPARLREAEESLRQAVDLGDATATVNLAALRLRLQDPTEALELSRRYLALAPGGKAQKNAHIEICHARAMLDVMPEKTGTSKTPGEVAQPTAQAVQLAANRARDTRSPKSTLFSQRLDTSSKGTVRIDTVIDEEGCVVESKVVKPEGTPLEAQALQASRLWVFEPATDKGKPVRSNYRLGYNDNEPFKFQPIELQYYGSYNYREYVDQFPYNADKPITGAREVNVTH